MKKRTGSSKPPTPKTRLVPFPIFLLSLALFVSPLPRGPHFALVAKPLRHPSTCRPLTGAAWSFILLPNRHHSVQPHHFSSSPIHYFRFSDGEHGLVLRFWSPAAPSRVPVPPDRRGAGCPLPQEESRLRSASGHHHRRGRLVQVRSMGATEYEFSIQS